MGWLISVALLVTALVLKSETLFIAAGLFGIAGAISFAAALHRPKTDNNTNNTNNTN